MSLKHDPFKNVLENLTNEIFYFYFFHTKSLQSDIDFVEAAYLSLDTKFSWERFYLNFYFIKFTIEKVDSHTQIVLKILASDLIAEWNTSSEILKGRAARSPVPWMQQPHCTRVPETRGDDGPAQLWGGGPEPLRGGSGGPAGGGSRAGGAR